MARHKTKAVTKLDRLEHKFFGPVWVFTRGETESGLSVTVLVESQSRVATLPDSPEYFPMPGSTVAAPDAVADQYKQWKKATRSERAKKSDEMEPETSEVDVVAEARG